MVEFDLPAHGQMPATQIVLQYEDVSDAPDPETSRIIANAIYLALRSCPDVRRGFVGMGRLNFSLIVHKSGIEASTSASPPPVGFSCLKEAIEIESVDLSARVSASVVVKDEKGADAP
jgi:hypothetical protein